MSEFYLFNHVQESNAFVIYFSEKTPSVNVYPRGGREGSNREYNHSFTLSLHSAVFGGEGSQRHARLLCPRE
jgi:hypothetical protein